MSGPMVDKKMSMFLSKRRIFLMGYSELQRISIGS
jgi:hypothetical protein